MENESIWSIAANILSDNRAGMTPVWFETILKYNQNLWDEKKLFMQALQNHRKSETEKNTNRIVPRKTEL